VQTGSGGNPASCPVGTGVFSPWVKCPKLEADDSLPVSAEVKHAESYISTPPYVLIAWVFVKQGIRVHGVLLS